MPLTVPASLIDQLLAAHPAPAYAQPPLEDHPPMTPRPLPPLTKPYAPTVRVDVALLGVMCEYYRAFQQADRTRMWDQVDALDTPEIYQLLMITMDLIRHPDATVALTGSMLQLHEDLIIRLGHVLDLHRDEPF